MENFGTNNEAEVSSFWLKKSAKIEEIEGAKSLKKVEKVSKKVEKDFLSLLSLRIVTITWEKVKYSIKARFLQVQP